MQQERYERTQPIVIAESEIERLAKGERIEDVSPMHLPEETIHLRLEPVPDDVAKLEREYEYGSVYDWDEENIRLEVTGIPDKDREIPDQIARLHELGFTDLKYDVGGSVSDVEIARDEAFIAE